MRARLSGFLVALTLLFAGCTDAPDPTDDDGPGATGEGAQTDVPEWSVGDHWDYQTVGAMASGASFSLVVSGESGGDWLVDTTERGVAYHHALTGGISYMGEIRKSDLAGSQGSDRVQFFDFPLEDEKTWSTKWDGLDVQITAEESEPGKYNLVAMNGELVHAEYAYDEQVGFFTEARWLDDNGTVVWGMELTDSGESFSGNLVRYEIGDVRTYASSTTDTGLYEETVPEEWNELGLRILISCNGDKAGLVAVGVNTPDSSGEPVPMLPTVNEPEEGRTLDCSTGQVLDSAWTEENPGGTWEFGFIVSAPNAVAHLFLEERSRQEIPFPA